MFRQHTLKSSIHCTGIGVHSNHKVAITLLPGEIDSGILFRRTDLPSRVEIRAHYESVIDTRLCTMIGRPGGFKIGTVEHLLAAFAGAAIDNAVVEIDGDEVPIMDGSAAPFSFLIECAGALEQNVPRRAIEVLKPLRLTDGDRSVSLTPAKQFSLRCEIEYPHRLIGNQAVRFEMLPGAFKAELSRARTFCLLEDVERMRAAGLAQGGTLENAIVVGPTHILNEDGLRFADEYVRHKALDCIGDFALAGAPLIGHMVSVRAGHNLNYRLLRSLMADRSAWRLSTFEEATSGHAGVVLPFEPRAAIA
jgi:UDP-3-O-[3-hydroxymyristoyl] N-acetylglucosamine deacetylase